jgi:hypothetical protein
MAMAVPVRCEIGGRARQTTSRELGERGVFVYCAMLPELHAAARLTLYLPGGPLEVAATVRTVEGQPPGFWADFGEQTDAVHAQILRALASTFEQVETPAGGVAKFDPTRPAAGRNRRAVARSRERLPMRLDGVGTFTMDLGAAGLFAITESLPAEGSLMRVELDLPDAQPAAQATAVVIRRAQFPERGVALQLVDADDSFRARVDRYLSGRVARE